MAQPNAPGAFVTTNVLDIASPDNACPVEPHAKAINPVVVECHAKFAPLPVIPPVLEENMVDPRPDYSHWLIEQLQQPDVCGPGAEVGRHEACAILIYVLNPAHRQIGAPRVENYAGPWTHVVRIFRVSDTTDTGNATVEVVLANESEDYFGTGRKPVWNLLAEQRGSERCTRVKNKSYVRDNGSVGLPDACARTIGDDPSFIPMLLLPRSKAGLVLNDKAIRHHFNAPPYYVD